MRPSNALDIPASAQAQGGPARRGRTDPVQAMLAGCLGLFGVVMIPIAAGVVAPIYTDFGVALPPVTLALLGIPPWLIAGLGAGAALAVTIVPGDGVGRSSRLAWTMGLLIAVTAGLASLLFLLAPLVRMTESLAA